MPKSSRHKSHKQSKHSSRDAKEQSESEEDVKIKSRIDKDESSAKTRDSASSEKRKLSAAAKDPSGHGSGDKLEEYVSSKRRKEKADATAASDRWNGGGKERGDNVITEKESKGANLRIDEDKSSKSIVEIVDSKSRSSRRHENGSDKKDESLSLVVEKEDNKTSSSKGDSKRKSEKDSGPKDVHQYKSSSKSKDKEHGLEKEKERMEKDNKRSTESRTAESEVVKEQVSHSVGVGEKHQGRRSKDNTECLVQDDPPNPESEKELEKRSRKRRDGANSKDKHQVDGKEIEDKRPSSRGERDKESRSKDEKHKDGSSRNNLHDDVSKGKSDDRHKDIKYQGDDSRDSRQKDTKYREDDNRGSKHKEDKHRGDGERDSSYRDDKYREEGDIGSRHRGDKYYEDGDRDNRLKENKFHEDSDRTYRQRGSKHREDGDRDDHHRDDWHLDDGNKDAKKRDFSRDSRHKDGAHKDDDDSDKRHRGTKYLDERSARDRSGGKSDYKRLRDEKDPADLHHKRSNNRDGSPPFDDRSTGYKDEKSKRITNGKEEHDDGRSRSARGNYYEDEKRSVSGARVTLVNDRGRSSTRRSSPSSSSHAAKDHYRFSKQEESKYSNYAHEERSRHDVSSRKEYASSAAVEKTSFSRPSDKSSGKDDLHLGDFSTERRHKSDARTSPLKVVDKSPSSTNADHRYLSRSDVRRSLDIEESGQRSGGSKDGKDFSSREGRGSRNLHMDSHPGDEFSQADDNVSVSSPFTRSGHFSGHSRSLLPPQHPFRMGPDSPLALSSFEDDNRGKGNNRNRRMGDSNMGRMQGNSWRGVPSWPSPVPNGFIPFQHGPPSVGFHPVMQQFPGRPLFGVRPPMELNQSGVPYHVSDSDGFPGHGLTHGWRNPVDEPPFIHGWDPNNGVFGNESHLYGRLDGNHNRNLGSGRLWEANGDMWKGQNTELPPTPRKEDVPADEVLTNQSGLQTQKDQKQPNELAGGSDLYQPSDGLEKSTFEAPRPTEEEIMNISREEEARISHVYLTMLDISSDLALPEVYSQYKNRMGIDQGTKCDDADPKFVLVEESIKYPLQSDHKAPIVSLFSTMDDSVFQKAMSLYKKLRGEEVGGISEEDKVSGLNMSSQGSAQIVPMACDEAEPVAVVSDMEVCPPKPVEIADTLIPPTGGDVEKLKEAVEEDVHVVKMEIDVVPKQEPAEWRAENVETRLDAKTEEEDGTREEGLEGKSCVVDDAKCNPPPPPPLIVSCDATTVACEAVMPESVNLSRIQQSPPPPQSIPH